jgi:hypothetical protein
MIKASMALAPTLCRRLAIPRSLVAINPAWICRSMSTSTPRRRRSSPSKYPLQNDQAISPDPGGLRQAYAHGEENFDAYLAKASLSPWVPVPDPIARKMLEIARAGPDDVGLSNRQMISHTFLNGCTALTPTLRVHRFTSNWVLVTDA